MKSYPNLFAKLFCQPLMLHGPTRLSFESVLMERMSGAQIAPNAKLGDGSNSQRAKAIFEQIGNVAIVTIDGAIDKRISAFDMDCYGGVDLCDVDSALSLALHSSAEKIVLDIHSPGGSVVGVHETYSRILALSEAKEVHAYVNTMACSAGYYLASACDHIAAAPTAIVGSIGVYLAMIDQSRRLDAAGITVNVMQGGQWKTAGADYKPLADAERAMLQAKVDALYANFKSAVNARRPQVEDATMQGQWVEGREGLTAGLIDELTNETLDEYVAKLLMQ